MLAPAGSRILAAHDGLLLDLPGSLRVLRAALATGETSPVRLPVTTIVLPPVSTASAAQEAARLARLLAARITVVALGHNWLLSRSKIAAMLRLRALRQGPALIYADHVGHTAVTGYLWPRVVAIGRPGRDARVAYQGGHVEVISGRDGRVVDAGAAVAELAAAVARGASATLALPVVNGPTVSNAEAAATAARLRRTLRTTVVWLPRRHWAILPGAIAAALTLQRIPAITGALLVPHLDVAAIAASLPGSAALAGNAPRGAAVVKRGGRVVVIPAAPGHRPNYRYFVDTGRARW